VIIPDINLLLYAYDSDSPFHGQAETWLQRCLSAPEPVGFPPAVLFGFMRIATHGRVFQHPMTPAEAAGHVRSWLAQPCTQILDGGALHIDAVLNLLEEIGTAGNLVTDAQIAVLAMEHDAVLHTADADFLRFPKLRWFNPLTGLASAKPRAK
jgi:uncharacterized protein